MNMDEEKLHPTSREVSNSLHSQKERSHCMSFKVKVYKSCESRMSSSKSSGWHWKLLQHSQLLRSFVKEETAHSNAFCRNLRKRTIYLGLRQLLVRAKVKL